jgi:L-2,4-diaminobutyrate decarboxylase
MASFDADGSDVAHDVLDDPDFAIDEEGLLLAVRLLREFAPLEDLAQRGDREVADLLTGLAGGLPEDGLGSRAALEALAPAAIGAARPLGHPGFFAHMDPPTPWVTWAATLWMASRNQNLLHLDTAPVARELEHRVVAWLAPFFGKDGGHLVPDSTLANLTALWAARELRGVAEVVASEAAHLSVRKSAHLLGLGFRSVPVGVDDRLLPDALGDLHHAALVLTAGTTMTGSIDPLDAGQAAAWRHLDAAWAGPLRLSRRHAALLDGVEGMDSVAISAHKWLFQPKESALVLFGDTRAAHDALSFGSGYLAVPNVGLLGSHGAAALPLAATLLAWGRAGVAARIERCMDLVAELDRRVDAEPRLERFAPPRAGVYLWRPRGVDPAQVRAGLRGAYVSLARHRDEWWLRSVAANPMAEPARVVDAVLEAAAS